MNIIINDRHSLLSGKAQENAEARVNASLSKFGNIVKAIEITVQDVNGPRGGVDKECRVLIRLKKMKDVVVTVRDEALSKAILSAVNRASRSVGRSLDRRTIRGGSRLSKLGFEI